MSTRVGSAALAAAVLAFAAGCAEPAYTGPYTGPPNVEGAPVVTGPVEDYGEVVYVDAPPVVDIETYPFIVYGGVNVYYVSGRWYQRGPRGWAYYRQEPPELDRQRQEHWQRDHDQRWVGQPGVERQGSEQRAAPPPPPPPRGVTEPQPRDRGGPPAEPRREYVPAPPAPQAQPHREKAPAPPAPTAQPHRDEPPSPRQGPPPVKPAPVHSPEHQPEHR